MVLSLPFEVLLPLSSASYVDLPPGAAKISTPETPNDTDSGDVSEPSDTSNVSSLPLSPFVLPVPSIPDIISAILPAGQVHLFSGASGAGKTALTFQLLSSMFSGEPFFGLKVRKPSFLGYLAADRTWDSHAIWLHTVGLQSLPHYSLIQDLSTSGQSIRKGKFGDRFQLFRRCIAQLCISEGLAEKSSSVDSALTHLPKDSFLVVDPISLFIGGDLNKYDQVYSHMLDLNQFCIRHSCTILGIAHAGKQKSDPAQKYTRPQDRIVGTTAQTGCAGTTMHLAPDTETGEQWSEFCYIPHHAPAGGFRLNRDNSGLFISVNPALPSRREQKKKERELEAPSKVLLLLPEDYAEVHIQEIVDLANSNYTLKRSMVYRYLTVLEESGDIQRGKKLGYWKRKKKD